MIFLTVGTEYPFDRLVRAIDEMAGDSLLDEPVFAQIGDSPYRPRYLSWVSTMERSAYDRRLQECSAVIGHAGSGTIMECLWLRKPLLVMPRLKHYGEHVNDHQLVTARKFESRGDILVAWDRKDLLVRLRELREFRPPERRSACHQLTACIKRFLQELDGP